MKLTIDHVNDLTDWTITTDSSISLNEHDTYIAGLNDNSLLAKMVPGDNPAVLSKSYGDIDVSDYETLVFSMGSHNLGKNSFIDNEFYYKIAINDSDEFYIPVRETFTDINIAIDDITVLNKIEITTLTSNEDYIWLSEIVVEQENVVLDMMKAVKEYLEYELDELIGDGKKIGTISGSAGDSEVQAPDASYLEQYGVYLIDDGTNSETHQIDDIDSDGKITFMSTFDGKTLKNNYTDTDIKIVFPVKINPDERDICIPGLVIWGFVPTPIYRTGKLDRVIDAYKLDGSFVERPEGQLMTMPIQIDCEARQASLLDIAARAVRFWLEKEIVWVNGRFHELSWSSLEAANEIQPPSGIDIIPKVQYNLNIETQEIFGSRETLQPVTETTLNVIPTEDL